MPPLSPLQQAVADLVATLDVAGVAVLNVDRSPKPALGEVRVHVDRTDDGPPDAEAVATMRHALSELPAVRRATAIPPRVYLTLEPEFIERVVVDAAINGQLLGDWSAGSGRRLMLSFSDPNVNKPLHLGHLRNNVLGMALCRLFEGAGWKVECQADHNDWGLPLCQTACAYRRWGNGQSPTAASIKGDHFVGSFYALFHEKHTPTDHQQQAAANEAAANYTSDMAGQADSLDREAADLLRALEDGDPDTRALCRQLTGWAEAGVQATYRRIGTRMDRIFYGSAYVDPGNDLISAAVAAGRLAVRPDGSVYADLNADDLGEVTLVRSEGTPLFYRQWLAMDVGRFGGGDIDWTADQALLVSGREWRPGFDKYFCLLRRLDQPWVDHVTAIFYGMVNLPQGRLRSREGAAVTIDALVDATHDRLAAEPGLPCSTTSRTPHDTESGPPHDTESGLACGAESGLACGAGSGTPCAAEQLAVAVLAWHFLRHDRETDFTFTESDLWRTSYPQVAACVELITAVGTELPVTPHRIGPALNERGQLRRLLLDLDRLPDIASSALATFEPARLVRYLERLLALTDRVSARHELPPHIRDATAQTIHTALALLNIRLPAPPPPSGRAREPGASSRGHGS